MDSLGNVKPDQNLYGDLWQRVLDTYYKLYNKWKVYGGIINIGCNEGVGGGWPWLVEYSVRLIEQPASARIKG